MAAKTSGASPDKRRTYDEAFKAESPRRRWQQAQPVAEVSSEEVARAPEGRPPWATRETSHHVACYNAERRHFALGCRAPNHFETHFQTTAQRCPA